MTIAFAVRIKNKLNTKIKEKIMIKCINGKKVKGQQCKQSTLKWLITKK